MRYLLLLTALTLAACGGSAPAPLAAQGDPAPDAEAVALPAVIGCGCAVGCAVAVGGGAEHELRVRLRTRSEIAALLFTGDLDANRDVWCFDESGLGHSAAEGESGDGCQPVYVLSEACGGECVPDARWLSCDD